MNEINAASGNSLNAASGNNVGLVNAGNSTFNLNRAPKAKREPFVTASLRAKLKTRADKTYLDSAIENISRVENSDIDGASKAAIIATINAELAHNLNVEDVVQRAFSSGNIEEDADIDAVDPEWAARFTDFAGSKYSSEAQDIWAKLLVEEINSPGCFSKKTLSILDDMDPSDARTFKDLCERCIGGSLPNGGYQEPLPLMVGLHEDYSLDANAISRLKDLGLVSFDIGGVGMFTMSNLGAGGWQLINVGKHTYYLSCERGGSVEIVYRGFTRFGIELSRLCDLGVAEGFEDSVVSSWLESGAEVGIVTEMSGSEFKYAPICKPF